MAAYKEIVNNKGLFRDITWKYLSDCMRAFESSDKLSASIWASVFLESLLKDILGVLTGSSFLNEEMNSLVSRLRNALNNGTSKYNLFSEDISYLEDIIRRSDEIRLKRNRLVHSTGIKNAFLDSDADDIYKNIIAIINNFSRTSISGIISAEEKQKLIINNETVTVPDFPMYISMSEPYSFEQSAFVEEFCTLLKSIGIKPVYNPSTNHDNYSIEVSKRQIEGCQGVIIIGLEETHSFFSKDKEGSQNEKEVIHRRYSSSLLQIEAGISIGLEKRIFILCQKGLYPDGIFGAKAKKDIAEFKVPLDINDPQIKRIIGILNSFRLEKRKSSYKDISISFCDNETDQTPQDDYEKTFNRNANYDITEDYIRLTEEAEEGNIQAMYEAGMMSYYGLASEYIDESRCDYKKATVWLKKVMDSDSPLRFHAMSIIARMYFQGLVFGEQQSYKKCFNLHSSAAANDDYSKRETAFLQRNGIGCSFDFNEIKKSLEDSIIKKDDETIRASALFLKTYGKYKEALELYNSVQIMSPETEYQMGMLLLQGVHEDPPRPDYYQAAYHLRNAADSHHILAAFQYGLMCLRAPGGLKKDFNEAEKYLKFSADSGYDQAQNVLGYLYRTGLVKKNLSEAEKYFELAYRQKNVQAALELATLYQQPECCNYRNAYKCAVYAADCGSSEGKFILGNLLFLGRGCEVDLNRALEMYQEAYDEGIFFASVMLEKLKNVLA